MTQATPEQVEQAKQIIRDAIASSSQCFWPNIVSKNNHRVPIGALRQASGEMQSAGEMRMKEDAYEHAWEYRLNTPAHDRT